MLFSNKFFISLYKTIIIFTCIIWANVANSNADDDYLKAMEVEAESSNTTQSTKTTSNVTTAEKELKQKQKQEFETRLNNELPTSYKSYRMLSEEKKQAVVSTYFDNKKNMPMATRVLFNLYFNK